MSESEFCRVCADYSDKTSPLFEGSLRKLLPKIKDITGLQLENLQDMPQNICKTCQKQILQAHKFRDRCIRAQKRLGTLCNQNEEEETSKSKEPQLPDSPNIKDEASPIEEVILNEVNTHKLQKDEEEEDVKETYKRKKKRKTRTSLELKKEVPPIEEVIFNETNEFKAEENAEDGEVLLKQEPTIAEGSSNSSFNCLADDFHDRDEDTLAVQPEISLITAVEEKSLPGNITKVKKKLKIKPKTLKTEKTIEKKKRRSAVERNYVCDQCGKHYTNTSLFNIHLLRHTGNRPFQCKLCPKAYYRSVDLENHMMKHTGEKPYPCKYCERRFNDKSHLVRHTRGEHTNERPFVCDQCPKTFISSNNLKHHSVTHTGVRAYKCKLCNMSYKRTTHLSGHYKSVLHRQNLEKQQKLDNQTTEAPPECSDIV